MFCRNSLQIRINVGLAAPLLLRIRTNRLVQEVSVLILKPALDGMPRNLRRRLTQSLCFFAELPVDIFG